VQQKSPAGDDPAGLFFISLASATALVDHILGAIGGRTKVLTRPSHRVASGDCNRAGDEKHRNKLPNHDRQLLV
jgi:hypothetical protein